MDKKSAKVILEEVEKGAKFMNTKIDQYKQVMNCSWELKQKMKEEFYKQKIQEAKDMKVKPIVYNKKIFRFVFKWDELPAEVEKQILDYKEEIDKVYIKKKIKKNNLTFKSVISKKANAVQIEYDRITRDKTPSLEDYIKYRKEDKKELKDRKKKKKKEPIVYTSDYKIGDIICSDKKVVDDNGDLLEMADNDDSNACIFIHPYRIIGETKAQYRVERLTWDSLGVEDDYDGYIYIYELCIADVVAQGKGIKSNNIGKKSVLKLDTHREYQREFASYDYLKKN